MLLSKTKNLESENNGMEEAIDLMKVELQNMNTNEQGKVSKVRDIDSQNQALLEESSALKQESDFYKDKSRQLEIQLTQAVGNERILNENARAMEDRNIQLQNEVARLKESGSRAYEELARESQQLQLQLNEIAGREMAAKQPEEFTVRKQSFAKRSAQQSKQGKRIQSSDCHSQRRQQQFNARNRGDSANAHAIEKRHDRRD